LDKHTGQFESHPFERSQLEIETFFRLKELDENIKKIEQQAAA
jgi:hypothetical protein